jgi:hypothetical protein
MVIGAEPKSIQAKRNLTCHPRALNANNAVIAV